MLNNISRFHQRRNNWRGLERQRSWQIQQPLYQHDEGPGFKQKAVPFGGRFFKTAESVAHHKADWRFQPRSHCLQVA